MLFKADILEFNNDGTAKILTNQGDVRNFVPIVTNTSISFEMKNLFCIYGYLDGRASSPIIISIFNDKRDLNFDNDKIVTFFNPFNNEVLFDYDGDTIIFRKPIKVLKNGNEEFITSNGDPVTTGGNVISVL